MTSATQPLSAADDRPGFDWRYWFDTNLRSPDKIITLVILIALNVWIIGRALSTYAALTTIITVLAWAAVGVAIIVGTLSTGIVPKRLRPIKSRLYTSLHGSFVSLFLLVAVVLSVQALLRWISDWSRWRVIVVNLRLFMVGRYPAEEMWRPIALLILFLALMVASLLTWGPISRRLYRFRAIILGLWVGSPLIVIVVLNGISTEFLIGFAIVAAALTVVSLFTWGPISRRLHPFRNGVLALWAASPILVYIVFRIFGLPLTPDQAAFLPPVGTNLWGGLMLTILISVIAIVASFPLGVLLALGRRSQYPVVKAFCVGYIELIRGVPLITVLFMAEFMLPLFLPGEITVDRLVRITAGFTLFSAAYLAENVRGGLQAIPRGQYEAAYAVGLNNFQSTRFIILPQALRAVIPAIVGQFIGLFKDTSLVAIIGLFDLLNIGKAVLGGQAEFRAFQAEVYLFVGVIYFVGSAAMSMSSRRLEKRLGVGER